MSHKDTGGDAFPFSTGTHVFKGMTLRDHFAGQALIAILSSDISNADPTDEEKAMKIPEFVAHRCYLFADAMIKERNK